MDVVNGKQLSSVDEATETLMSLGPLLPANPEDTTCYCGKDRDLTISEFQCGMCLRYYHETCIGCLQGGYVPFMTNYQFFCKRCSGQESFNKRPASFGQMCLTALANLTQQNQERTMFSKDKEIIPYIELHWDQLTSASRRVKNTWHSSIGKTMSKDTVIFIGKEEVGGEMFYGLVNQDLTKIGPNCESLFRLTCARPAETKTVVQPETKSRAAKRKAPDAHVTGAKQRKGDVSYTTRLIPTSYPQEHPFNKDGYRYHLAEPDPHAPNWQAFDESVEWAGKPIPGYLYRLYLEPQVMLSLHDRAPQLKVSDDRLSVTGEKGYSMIRATHGVKYGSWYYEVTIADMPSETAVRMGWSQSLGNLQAPCGYDKFSYSWRSKKGTVFNQSRGKHYSSGYEEKDVLGFYVSLPPLESPAKLTPPQYKDNPLVKFKSHLYYEEKDNVANAEKKLKVLKGSKMIMYKNGESQNMAFADIFGGTYYPAISLYKNATVTVNFGPNFKFPPTDITSCKPMSEAVMEVNIQHTLGDMLYHVEHEGQQPEF